MTQPARILRLPGAIHDLQVTWSQSPDSLVAGGRYLAGIRLETPAGVCNAALTVEDCVKLRDYLDAMIVHQSHNQ